MDFNDISGKISRRLWERVVVHSRNKAFYPYLYTSVWHSKLLGSKTGNQKQYFSSVPNPGAGIGHQMANWIAGYWFAQQFGLKFAHIPFSNAKWEDFLGFGRYEVQVDNLVKNFDFKKVLLPLFDEHNQPEVNLIRSILLSYQGQNVVFITEQDQFYRDQFGVQNGLQEKFFTAPSRINDRLIFSNENFNIAIHVRRGDIINTVGAVNENLNMRFQQNDYFIKVLSSVISELKVDRPVMIYLFSQGEANDFKDFKNFNNIFFCLDMSAMDSFLHMVKADLLITSKSSFSYKPALLSKGIKVCPEKFWHGYPNTDTWILANDQGDFDNRKLNFVHG
jgi:hypothetical protein